MTHDELLAKIDAEIVYCGCDGYVNCGDDNEPWNALRAVVELHKPWDVETEGGTFTLCNACSRRADLPGYGILYPCKTIYTIEKELS